MSAWLEMLSDSRAASAIWAMVVASLLPFIMAMIAKLVGGFRFSDNANPRDFLARTSGMAARANAAQKNSYESLPIFLVAVVVAMLFFVPQGVINKLAWLYVLIRIAYCAAYITNLALFRSILWLLSLACSFMLFYLAIRISG